MMLAWVVFVALVSPGDAPGMLEPVNAVIGDASWVARHGEPPTANAGEVDRIRIHLDFVAAHLAAADVSHLDDERRQRRARAIDGLSRYAAAGVFPRRDPGDGYGPRRPRFIDDRGVHCAVGELVRTSGHGALAQAIDDGWSYAYVSQMDAPALLAWADAHGFTPRELAMIQPTYGPVLNGRTVRANLAAQQEYFIMRCGRTHPVPKRLTLRVQLEARYVLDVSVVGESDPFSECVRTWAHNGGRALPGMSTRSPLGRPPLPRGPRSASKGSGEVIWPVFDETISLDLEPPPRLLVARLRAIDLKTEARDCWSLGDRPVERVRIHMQSDVRGTRVHAETTPAMAPVAACFERFARQRVIRTAGGPWSVSAEIKREERTYLYPRRLGELTRPLLCPAVDHCFAHAAEVPDVTPPPAGQEPVSWPVTVDVEVRSRKTPVHIEVESTADPRASGFLDLCIAEQVAQGLHTQLTRDAPGPPWPFIDGVARKTLEARCPLRSPDKRRPAPDP